MNGPPGALTLLTAEQAAPRTMSPSLALVAVIAVLFAAGVYLMLERSLTRILVGVVLAGNGANLLYLVAGGAAGDAPFVPAADAGAAPVEGLGTMADPLPQAMVLTSIVITLAMTAFLLAMAYRSWQLHGHDEVADDVEDRRIARDAARRAGPRPPEAGWVEAGAAQLHDQTEEPGEANGPRDRTPGPPAGSGSRSGPGGAGSPAGRDTDRGAGRPAGRGPGRTGEAR